jgi:hypothetical protein
LRGFGLVRAGRGDLDPRWSRRRAHQQRRDLPRCQSGHIVGISKNAYVPATLVGLD